MKYHFIITHPYLNKILIKVKILNYKKLASVVMFGLMTIFVLSSCTKSYQCECKIGDTTTRTAVEEGLSKKGAQNACNGIEATVSQNNQGVSVECKVVPA